MTLYKFHWTAQVEKWAVKDWLHQKRGREPSAAAQPGCKGGPGRDPRKPQARRRLERVNGTAAFLVREATATNTHITWLLQLCCFWNSQLIFLIPSFIPLFLALCVILCHRFKIPEVFIVSRKKTAIYEMPCHMENDYYWGLLLLLLLLSFLLLLLLSYYLEVSRSYSIKTWLFKTKQNKVLSKPSEIFVFVVCQPTSASSQDTLDWQICKIHGEQRLEADREGIGRQNSYAVGCKNHTFSYRKWRVY